MSSAAYGHSLGRAVALGYVTAPEPGTPALWYTAGDYEIEIANVDARPPPTPRCALATTPDPIAPAADRPARLEA